MTPEKVICHFIHGCGIPFRSVGFFLWFDSSFEASNVTSDNTTNTTSPDEWKEMVQNRLNSHHEFMIYIPGNPITSLPPMKIVWNQQPLKGISRSDHLTQCSFINQWTRLRKLINLRRSGTRRKDDRQLGVLVLTKLMNDTCAAIEIHWIYPPQPVTVANEGLWRSLTKDIKILVVTVTEWGAYPRYIYIYTVHIINSLVCEPSQHVWPDELPQCAPSALIFLVPWENWSRASVELKKPRRCFFSIRLLDIWAAIQIMVDCF